MADFQRMGPHVIKATGDALNWARQAPIVKALNDPSPLRAARPDAIKIYRKFFPVQDINRPGGEVVDEVMAALGDAPCDLIELYNETAQHQYENLDRYITFHEEATSWLETLRPHLVSHRQHIQILGYSFSTGCPEQEDWELLRSRNYGGVKVIGIHEYWGRQGFTEWHALRHRNAHKWTEGDHPPFCITECGIDAIEGGTKGWKLMPGLTGQQYLDQLKGYDAEIGKDAYVVGATPFTAGPTPDWSNFETDSLVGMMRLTPQAPALSIPPYQQEAPVYEFEGAFVAYAAEHPEVGQAAGTLDYDQNSNAFQQTTTGTLAWWDKLQQVVFYPTGSEIIEPEAPPALVQTMDVASYQPIDLTELIQQNSIKHVIVRAYLPWERISQEHTRAQVASAIANGCSVDLYCWAYSSNTPEGTVIEALKVAESCELGLLRLWFDCETYTANGVVVDRGPTAEWIQKARLECGANGIEFCVYTGVWWLRDYLPNYAEVLQGVPLWLAEYNHTPDLDSVALLEDIDRSMLVGHQYSADGIDLSVFNPAYVGSTVVEPEEPPVEDVDWEAEAKALLAEVVEMGRKLEAESSRADAAEARLAAIKAAGGW